MSDDKVLMDHRNKLQANVNEVEERLAPLYAERDKVVLTIEQMTRELQEGVGAEIKKIEEEELVPVRNSLARVARVMGGRSLGDRE